MVVAHKSNGARCFYVDLTNVNKAIVPVGYPLHTIDELAEFFGGSRFFSKIDLSWAIFKWNFTIRRYTRHQ